MKFCTTGKVLDEGKEKKMDDECRESGKDIGMLGLMVWGFLHVDCDMGVHASERVDGLGWMEWWL